jgi:hypothetical protein
VFVAPAASLTFAPPRPRTAAVGVLAAGAQLLVAAGEEAARLRRESRSGAVLVCVWRPGAERPFGAPVPALPWSTRAAARLGRRGIEARAAGAVAVVALPDDVMQAVASARRAMAAFEGPAVVAASRRDPGLDTLLASLDRLVLAPADDAGELLARLAHEDLARLGPPVEVRTIPAGALRRRLAQLGLVIPGFAREAVVA